MRSKTLIVVAAFMVVTIGGGCADRSTAPQMDTGPQALTPAPEGVIQWMTDLNAGLAAAKAANKPLMVDFYADWCGWCKKLDRDVYTTTEVIKLSKNFVNVKVNTDKDREAAQKYRVQGLPTVIFMRSDGTVVEQIVGYRDADEFVRVMTEVLQP